jgi:glutamine synthetase
MVKSKEDVLAALDANKVKYIRLLFTDVIGQMKGMSITRSEIEQVLEEGQGFDGSSVEGYVRIEESDLMAIPDRRSFRIIPWEIAGERVACMFCDIQNPDGTPFEGDPRHVLKRVLGRAAEKGYTFYCGPEIEFFYFRNGTAPETLDRNGYQEALVMADFAMIYRFVIKELALAAGAYASFMPKPIARQNGSGMHTHMSLFTGERNLFFNPQDAYHLSPLARAFIAGILHHVRDITLVLNQWVNSYKRLVVGYEAPVYVSWGRRNRSSLVRVPMYRVGKEKATRIELRSPDPACNPYLAFACMLAAGLEGIEKGYPLPDPVEENIFHMAEDDRQRRGITSLPGSLEEACGLAEKSALLRETLGEHIFRTLLANKRLEWDRYRMAVTDFEIAEYLPLL